MRHLLLASITLLAVFAAEATAFASGRDADGSRMQARPHDLGSTDKDSLNPPADSVDWRYVRLVSRADVTFELQTDASAKLAFTLTDAKGKTVARGTTARGRFQAKRTLDPGLYYISVSGDQSAEYQISVR